LVGVYNFNPLISKIYPHHLTASRVSDGFLSPPISANNHRHFAGYLPKKKAREQVVVRARMRIFRDARTCADDLLANVQQGQAHNKNRTMKTMTNPDGGGRFSSTEFELNPDHGRGRGRGLESIGDALASAGVCDSAAPMARQIHVGDVDTMPIRDALASAAQPAGGLLLEAQGQHDLALSRNCADKLAGRMRASGAEVNQDIIADATGAGALALTQWRATGAGVDGEPETLAARVAWRAVVRAMSADRFGDSLSINTVSDDWLWHNAEQRDESREERAARFKVERMAATRQLRLCRRLASLPSGRGNRAAVIERVNVAAQLMLGGARLDEAAAAAGFNARGEGRARHSAGDAFCTALRRLGFKIHAHARQSLREPSPRRGEFVALAADKVAAVLGGCFTTGEPQAV
jgi:hypothetical protein